MVSQNPIIVALDMDSPLKALQLVKKLKVTGVAFKVGFELFCAGGPKLVERIVGHDVRVFLDLKFHDIPNTVGKASEVATKLGVWMFNVHASGGVEMMTRAKDVSLKVAYEKSIKPPLVVAVTVLTSMNSLSEMNVPLSIPDQVMFLSQLALNSGLDGVVCSAQEVGEIQNVCGKKFVLVTPGIRPAGVSADDQKRTLTPQEAMKNGSHYLVMGRPLLNASKPLEVIDQVLKDLN